MARADSVAAAVAEAPGFLLGRGNSKLGDRVYTFSLPARDTCPGATELCRRTCYATRGHFRRPSAKAAYARSLAAARSPLFTARVAWEVRARKAQVVRIHVSGDFFSAAYARAWVRVARALPAVRFYAYTRSWRVPKLVPALEALAALPNVRLFYSVDRETGLPGHVPPAVRLAYMAVAADDVPPPAADLVFLDSPLRRAKRLRTGGVLVCPFENGTGWGERGGTCEKCGLCIRPLEEKDPRTLKRTGEARRAIPLAVV